MAEMEEWKPGSFTKNYSWGPKSRGLRELHEAIRLGFDGKMTDVSRERFRKRVEAAGRPDFIPINFFLFNRPSRGIDYLVADELVFQALNYDHSSRFDKLALFAFNFSYVGRWTGSKSYQRRPALWAFHYIRDRVSRELDWNTKKVSASDIEQFVSDDPRYQAETTRKLATNLNYLYSVGRLSEFGGEHVERWWVDSLFLALDRLIEDRRLDGLETSEKQYGSLLASSDFQTISGRRSVEKDMATKHLITLYAACGGRDRFSDEKVSERTTITLQDVQRYIANDPDNRPQAAVHPANPRILKSIPRVCAMLARYAGFDVIDADELANFDPAEFIRRRTQTALDNLLQQGIRPTMTAEELMRMTRSK
jgi:hypothetical protein